jgi:AbrB family looped-hinge helix DNA binding protein
LTPNLNYGIFCIKSITGYTSNANGRREMNKSHKFYGKVPVGTKGQIVIPLEARKAMNIKPGDSVIVISGPPRHEKIVSIIPEEEFNKFLQRFEEHINSMKREFSKKSSK